VKTLQFNLAAKIELIEAIDYFNQKVEGLGDRFSDSIGAAVRDIQNNPLAFPSVERVDCRSNILLDFPYVIYFQVKADEIRITAIAHASRRPGYWLRRLR